MKTNLKNKPRCCLDDKHYCGRDAWFADFEAELREIINCEQSWHPYPTREVEEAIKEILGEE